MLRSNYFFKVEQGRTGAAVSTGTVVSIMCYSLDPESGYAKHGE